YRVDVVCVVAGWAGGIVIAEMATVGKKVVALERGDHKNTEAYIVVKYELSYTHRFQMMQNLKHETVTSRNNMDETALPVRTKDEMMAGTDLGGGSVHWAGATYRFWPYEFEIRSKTIERYGKDKIPKDMNLQDW